ncbi:hypothetical protein KXV85_006283, partial [Aspergillus fumigatus]
AASRIHAHIVRVLAQPDTARRAQRGGMVKPDCPVAPACHNQLVKSGKICHALRPGEAGDAPSLSIGQIDTVDRAIGNFGNEQTAMGDIDRKMIDPPLDVRQGDFALKRERRPDVRSISPRASAKTKHGKQGSNEEGFHGASCPNHTA